MAKPTAKLSKPLVDDVGLRLPEPRLQPHRPEVAVVAKPKAAVTAVFDGRSIVQSLALNSAQARDYRLKELAKKNNDVKWLVEEYEKLKTK